MKTVRNSLWLLALAMSFFLSGCEVFDKVKNPFSRTSSIEEVISYATTPGNDLDQEFILEGYFWNESAPILITDLSLLEINAPLPIGSYISLAGTGIEEILTDTEFMGAQVRVRGTLSRAIYPQTKIEYWEFRCPEKIIRLKPRKDEIVLPYFGSLCERFPFLCQSPIVLPENNRYALLYSGGINLENAHRRYWNDLSFMYATLRNTYGYKAENIIVVYKDGVAEDASMPVNFSATRLGLSEAITALEGMTLNTSDLFVFVTNHGGGLHRCNGHQGRRNTCQSGMLDGNLDEGNPDVTDEVVFFYNENDSLNILTDDVFARVLKDVPHRNLITVLEPCFSGGFLADMPIADGITVSACDEDELSYGGLVVNGVQFDYFSYFFTEAMNQADPAGNPLSINPDTDGNGRISVLEAFLYARDRDIANETPFLDANGDGVGDADPTLVSGDGASAATVFF